MYLLLLLCHPSKSQFACHSERSEESPVACGNHQDKKTGCSKLKKMIT